MRFVIPPTLSLLLLTAVGPARALPAELITGGQTETEKKSATLLRLNDAVELAIQRSDTIQILRAQQESATAQADAASGARYPRLSLEGSYRNQSVVPEAKFGPTAMPLTDYYNYSIGPTLTYTLFDAGQKSNQAESLQSMASAKKKEQSWRQSQLTLQTQLAYLQTSLAAELVTLTRNALQLSLTQNRDIRARLRSGSVSQSDALASDSEVLNAKLKVSQAETDLAVNRTELATLLQLQTPELAVTDLKGLLREVKTRGESREWKPEVNHPQMKTQDQLAKATLVAAQAQEASAWPVLNLQLRSSLDYPNGPVKEQIQQNSVNLGLTWTLWDFHASEGLRRAKKAEALAAGLGLQEIRNQLRRDRSKVAARQQSLFLQIQDATELTLKQTELVKLQYAAYRYGKLSFSDVQTANLRWIEAENRLASLQAQYLSQLFQREYLNQEESEKP